MPSSVAMYIIGCVILLQNRNTLNGLLLIVLGESSAALTPEDHCKSKVKLGTVNGVILHDFQL